MQKSAQKGSLNHYIFSVIQTSHHTCRAKQCFTLSPSLPCLYIYHYPHLYIVFTFTIIPILTLSLHLPLSPSSLFEGSYKYMKTTAQGAMHAESKQAANLRAADKNRSPSMFPSSASPPARGFGLAGRNSTHQSKGWEDYFFFLAGFTRPDQQIIYKYKQLIFTEQLLVPNY